MHELIRHEHDHERDLNSNSNIHVYICEICTAALHRLTWQTEKHYFSTISVCQVINKPPIACKHICLDVKAVAHNALISLRLKNYQSKRMPTQAV